MFSKFTTWLFHNQGTTQTIAKNTFWLFMGQLVSRLFRATIVIYAARVLGAASWGAFSYALGIAAFLTIFSDIGINALITKEASRNPELKNQYLSTAFFTKLGLLAIFVIGTIAFFPYLTKIEEAALIMPILIFVFAFDTLRDLGSALSRALEKMEVEAGVQIFTNLIIVILGFLFLTANPTSYSLAFAYAIGSGIGLLAILYVLRDHFKNIFSNFSAALIRPIVSTAWPFALLGIMGAILLNTDIIMLGWLRTPEEVGYYSAAQKIVYLLYILPALLASGLFPVMARLAKNEPGRAKALLEKSIAIVFVIALPVALAGVLLGTPIINLLFGVEYSAAINTFKILMATILIVYPSTILGNAIFAYDHQRSFVWIVGLTFITNIAFNFLLIPPFGIEGAAIGTVVTQLLTNALIWRKMKKISGFKIWPQLKAWLLSLRTK